MAIGSSIEWTEATWNPLAGCSIISPGCTNCYAMRMAHRLDMMGQLKYADLTRQSGGRPKWNGRVNFDEESLEVPRKWKRGRLVFVNSMSDLFHDYVHNDIIFKIFDTMRETPQHTYQILTKRSVRLKEIGKQIDWPLNVWMGVSVESQDYWNRIEDLKQTSANVKFISFEPLVGQITRLDFSGIDWVIAGGESGPSARPVDTSWVRDIRDACVAQDIAFHFKQWGGVNKKKSGRILDKRTWDQMPPRWPARLRTY